MESFSLLDVLQQFGQAGIFGVLFIWHFHNTEKKAEQREQRLQVQIEKSQELLKAFADKYDIIEKKIDDLKESINKGV